jgi:hypothetical protein
MKKEIIDYYFGDFVTALGRPHIVLVGQEFEDKLICEKYILFEELNGSHSHIGEVVNSPIINGYSDNLEEFIENQGLEHAKSIIYLEAYKEQEKRQADSFNEIRINLRKTTQTSFMMYMKKKSETQLNWIAINTHSEKLKQLINFYKKVVITTSKID